MAILAISESSPCYSDLLKKWGIFLKITIVWQYKWSKSEPKSGPEVDQKVIQKVTTTESSDYYRDLLKKWWFFLKIPIVWQYNWSEIIKNHLKSPKMAPKREKDPYSKVSIWLLFWKDPYRKGGTYVHRDLFFQHIPIVSPIGGRKRSKIRH